MRSAEKGESYVGHYGDVVRLFPFLRKLFADSAYEGPIFHGARTGIFPWIEIEIVKRSHQVKDFVVLPKR